MEQTLSFEKLLNESRDLVCTRLAEALRSMLDKADEALAGYVGATRDQEAQKLYQDTGKVVLAQRAKLEAGFNRFYLKEFRFRTGAATGTEQGLTEVEESSLQLVGDEDLDETLKFKALATKVQRYCEEELSALDQRVGVLLGNANLGEEDNPFSPQTICDAYQQACRELDASLQVRGVLIKLFDDHVIDAVRSIYKDVNALLVKNGILPKIRYGVSKKPGDKAARGAADKAKDEKAQAGEGEDEANVFALLQKLLASGAGGAGVGGGPGPQAGQPVLDTAQLLGSLTRIQQGDLSAIAGALPAGASDTTNVLRELKASSLGAGMAQMDTMTLDIVAMIFDELFDDPKVPISIKGLIGRMQIPVLKVAIADKSFFAKKTHPARQMLDTLGEIALRLPADFDPSDAMFPKLEAVVQQVLDGFQEDMGVFEAADARLRALIAEEDQRVAAETQAVAERAAQAESLAIAKTAAEDEVRSRVQAHPLPGPVLEFLVEHWLRFLLLVHAKSGSSSAEWKDALDATDQLIWSVEPKKTPDERRKLAGVVPGLLKRITAGLEALGAGDQVRGAFFGQLMQYHTELLSAGAKRKGGTAPPPAAAAARSDLASLDFTAPVTVKDPHSGAEVQVTGIAAIDPPENLERGNWVEFRLKEGGEERRVAKKLLFVPPKKTRYIFSDRNGKEILELTRAEIVRYLRTGEAVRLEGTPEKPLFDRIMHGLMDKLRMPAAQHA